jgi:membrane-bound serine protease (ClpP class)
MKLFIKILLFSSIIFLSVNSLSSKVIVAKVDGAISPSTSEYIGKAIRYAEDNNSTALIIELNTPGGLLESTRDIVQDMLSSKVPIIVYITPSGARAGSAGVFITLASNFAAMSPGTNIGAAHPVGMKGEADSSTMFTKITNDAAAFIRTIAQKRHRNQEWAERAVRESISSTESEALKDTVIDLICPDINSLLDSLNGKYVETSIGILKLETAGNIIEEFEMSWRDKILALLADPNIAYVLLMLGMYGILFELYNPGAIFPGVIGGISALLAAYSFRMLPVNYAGLALILLALVLFIIDIKVTSHGLLTMGGIVSLFLGSMMLIDSPLELMSISLSIIITVVAISFLFFSFVITSGLKAQYRKRQTGKEAMIGLIGKALSDIKPNEQGIVRVHGEIWNATAELFIEKDEEVIVVEVDGLKLKVKNR